MEKNSQEIVIDVRDLTIGYEDYIVLKNLNFSVKKSEIFIILGGSGCGKSTVLKHLIGLYDPIKGDILIKGKSIVNATETEKSALCREFGVLYQSAALFSSLTLEENVAVPLKEFTNLPDEVIKSIAKLKLSLVGLKGYEKFLPSEISGGMKKRAGLARAMALDPEILFFDEPSAGLDPISSAGLDKLILELRDTLGCTMVIVTHELDSIFSIADSAIVLDQGSKGIIERGDPRELKKKSKNEWVREFLNRSNIEVRYMAKKGNIYKIGALALAALIILILGLLSLGVLKYLQPDIYFTTATEGTVQGLKVGSNVKIKGVTIGSVKSIKIGADASTIIITMKFDLDAFLSKSIDKIPIVDHGVQENFDKIVTPLVKRGLRCQLQYEGITGDMYVNLAYFDPKENHEPPIDLLEKRYVFIPMIPAASLGNILENIQLIGDKLNEVDFKKISDDADSVIIAIKELTLQIKEITDNSKINDLANNVDYSLNKFNQTMATVNTLLNTIQMQPDSVVWGKAGQKVVPSLNEGQLKN